MAGIFGKVGTITITIKDMTTEGGMLLNTAL